MDDKKRRAPGYKPKHAAPGKAGSFWSNVLAGLISGLITAAILKLLDW